MSLPVNVGQELLNVPFGEMIKEMALAIAEGQMALDLNSISVASTLADTTVDAGTVVVAIEETVNEAGDIIATNAVTNPNEMSLLALGLQPTFYQFTESVIDVKMDITMRSSREFDLENRTSFDFSNKVTVKGGFKTGGLAGVLFGKASASLQNTTSVAFSTAINARYKSKFSVEAHGTSQLKTTLTPVPPPERAVPRVRVLADGN